MLRQTCADLDGAEQQAPKLGAREGSARVPQLRRIPNAMLTVLLRRAAWNEGSASSQQKSRSRDEAAVGDFDESRSSRSTKYSSLRRCKTSVDLELHSLGPASAFDGDDAPDDGGGTRLTASALARHATVARCPAAAATRTAVLPY